MLIRPEPHAGLTFRMPLPLRKISAIRPLTRGAICRLRNDVYNPYSLPL